MQTSENFDFGRNLLNLREKKLLTQAELGALIGVSGAQIGRYESNRDRPRGPKVAKLASALEVSEADLMGYNVTTPVKPTFDKRKDEIIEALLDQVESSRKKIKELESKIEKLGGGKA